MLLKITIALMLCIAFVQVHAQTANRFDLVITEMMADPSPQVGLPNTEYIEIKNVSSIPFNINGWKLSDASSTATVTANFVLQPDSFVVFCSNSNVTLLSAFGRTIGVSSFPSLDNDEDQIVLRSPQNRIIHAVSYSTEWYRNEIKKDGGWSLEMIDTHNPCTGKNNWKASIDISGGTPGKKNSVDAVNTDPDPPQLMRTYSIDSTNLMAIFDEPLDSVSASATSNFTLGSIPIVASIPQAPLFDHVLLKLSTPMQKRNVYTLTVSNVKDCKGNTIGAFDKSKTGWSEEMLPGDIIINEILFNPKPGAADYVELYNRSNKIMDASGSFIANRNSSGIISSIKKLTENPFCIFPGDYIVLTEDRTSLINSYFVHTPDAVLELSALPSYPDDKGIIVITNVQGTVVDELSYSEKWHFALISDPEGVALERIDPNSATQDPQNWHSAASTAGYGTPTYQNSQYRLVNAIQSTIEVNPKIFSPDNDGHDDIASFNYQVNQPGYLANIRIFDANGRLVRYFVKNALLGLKGSWNWDGLDEQNQKLPVGIYVILTELFNLQGKKQQFRNMIVLARRLR
jgi:hypothetical protein